MRRFWKWLKRVLGLDEPKPGPVDPGPVLPTNPVFGPSAPGTLQQECSYRFKSVQVGAEHRFRWPTGFAVELGVGPGSWMLVNGVRCEFRGFDWDGNGPEAPVRRPSYQLARGVPIPAARPAVCILHDRAGVAVGWFKTDLRDGDFPLPAGNGA